MSITTCLDKMPHDLANKFKHKFADEYTKRKISYTTVHNNQEQTFVLDVYKVLVIHARKV